MMADHWVLVVVSLGLLFIANYKNLDLCLSSEKINNVLI